jgi:hypothetical protein
MLWTDGNFITAADLTSLDNEVAQVAQAESISLDTSIMRAIDEAGNALVRHLQEYGGAWIGNGSVTANHYAGVMNIGSGPSIRQRALLNQVVITGQTTANWTPLKRWAIQWVLFAFYRDAANRTQNDRYQDKVDAYKTDLHGQFWAAARAAGLPVVVEPIACPGALYEPDAGAWGATNLSLIDGSSTKTTAHDVVITYVDSGRSINGESHPSARASVTMQAGKVLRADISTLVPPTGTQPACTRPLAYVPYGKATHWNLYMGVQNGTLYLQTASPVAIATTTYTLAGDPVTGTRQVGLGQYADRYLSFQNWVHRG